MAAQFKIPKPKKRVDLTEELPTFSWEDVSVIQRVGIGAFGSVELANFRAATDANACQKF